MIPNWLHLCLETRLPWWSHGLEFQNQVIFVQHDLPINTHTAPVLWYTRCMAQERALVFHLSVYLYNSLVQSGSHEIIIKKNTILYCVHSCILYCESKQTLNVDSRALMWHFHKLNTTLMKWISPIHFFQSTWIILVVGCWSQSQYQYGITWPDHKNNQCLKC